MYKWAFKNRNKTERILATPGVMGICPLCDDDLLAKCGEVNVDHWAHINKEVCDHWWENKSPWHKAWQDLFPDQCQEVIFGRHIADVATHNTAIEFQASPLTVDVIKERTQFYRDKKELVRWVVKTDDFKQNIHFSATPDDDHYVDSLYAHFSWEHPRKCWEAVLTCGGLVIFDFPQGLFVGVDVSGVSIGRTTWHGWWGSKQELVTKHPENPPSGLNFMQQLFST